MRLYRFTLLIQTIYYFATAAWALVDINSFMKITGPKTDVWLVKTVAVLLLAICVGFTVSLFSHIISKPVIAMAATCCLVLIIIDCYYVWTKTISKVYLLDAVAEFILLVLWIITGAKIVRRQK